MEMTFYEYMQTNLNQMNSLNELAWTMHFDVVLFPTMSLENASVEVWRKRIKDKPYLKSEVVASFDKAVEKYKELTK